MSRRLNLSVQYVSGDTDVPPRSELRAWLRAALNVNGMRGGQITLRFVDEDEGRELNRNYRGRDYATNILSFPYENAEVVCGDLVICAPVVAKEAAQQGKTLTAHYAHLVIHGALHLQGYEHETNEADAQCMESCERSILAGFAYMDPYADEA